MGYFVTNSSGRGGQGSGGGNGPTGSNTIMNFSDEEAFQAYLDANPEDYLAREVFADWLQDRDDPRAEGYRALGQSRKKAWYFCGSENWGFFNTLAFHDDYLKEHPNLLPSIIDNSWESEIEEKGDKTRAKAEDAVALAWGKRTPERQAEILGRVGAGSGVNLSITG